MKINVTTTALIRHGEQSGSLVKSVGLARTILEHQDQLIKKCTGAMVYPIVIGIFAGAMIIGLVRGVMPSIIPMLISMHVQLPFMTRIVMWISDVVTHFGLYMLVTCILGSISTVLIYKKLLSAKYVVHLTMIHIPIIGSLIRTYSLGLFLQSCGSLLESGLRMQDIYSRTVETVSLLPMRKYFQSRATDVSNGSNIAMVFTQKQFPSYIPALLSAGEASGTLGSSCLRASSIISRDIDYSLKKMTALIEPVMMAGMGIVVGAIALSIMMPIYSMSSALQR
jgi:type II secretory pathway component PulF